MRCPCCGAPGFTPSTFLQTLRQQAWKVLAIVALTASGIVGQAEMLGEPWRHWVSVVALVGSSLVAARLQVHTQKEKEPV